MAKDTKAASRRHNTNQEDAGETSAPLLDNDRPVTKEQRKSIDQNYLESCVNESVRTAGFITRVAFYEAYRRYHRRAAAAGALLALAFGMLLFQTGLAIPPPSLDPIKPALALAAVVSYGNMSCPLEDAAFSYFDIVKSRQSFTSNKDRHVISKAVTYLFLQKNLYTQLKSS